MKTYAARGTGLPAVSALSFTPPPAWWLPATVTIRRGELLAPPSAAPTNQPPPGSWFNLAQTDPEDRRQIAAVCRRFGPLTAAGSAGGESLEIWTRLIGELRLLAGAWTEAGDPADPVARGAAWAQAMALQIRVVDQHQDRGGRFVSYGAAGVGLVTIDMDEWWRLEALNALWEGFPLRRCRFCGHWFSLKGQRADQGFGSPRCRSAFHQNRKPPSAPWAEVI
jgi:hypothetical protein